MKPPEIKRMVRRFRKEYGIRECTCEALGDVFERQGFTIISYNPFLNDPDVDTVVHAFGLEEIIARTSGFLYTDWNHRLLFVKEGLTDEEKRLVLAHEEGHYYCGHSGSASCIGRNVTEEYEANEFAHFLLQDSLTARVRGFARNHRKAVLICVAAVALAGCIGLGLREYRRIQESRIYEGEYYVTEHGERYHRKNCVTIQEHEIRRLTKEDVEAGEYEPCSVCQPDK